ncbi:(2Fe-2S)-binding protein [Roseomonas sp. HJA6]|uniref:(2Fe-2S)-binding protein n=1 Tax=Roseomonas alba TaxID=2846776 RepID=A0ABS7ADA9_9PROT|nr:(2Fe-2S)-binding protein [Neoroseomonas alba]MBW6400163.1 (2Fe-2S)-binding protein [Neoroseomonas alba]
MVELTVNGVSRTIEAEDGTPLLWVLREQLGMTGTKFGCGIAQCGACTVLVDGQATRSCSFPVEAAVGTQITTIEAIETHPIGRHVVDAWVEAQAPQCGYCQSGQVMAATALLATTPKPTRDDIEAAMTNICRCGTYNAIARAISLAGEKL